MQRRTKILFNLFKARAHTHKVNFSAKEGGRVIDQQKQAFHTSPQPSHSLTAHLGENFNTNHHSNNQQKNEQHSYRSEGRYRSNRFGYQSILLAGTTGCLFTLIYQAQQFNRFKNDMDKRIEPTHMNNHSNNSEIYATHVIHPDQMIGLEVNAIPDDKIYCVGFATKDGFVDIIGETDAIPITHSSILLQDMQTTSDKKFLIIGRQSPIHESTEHAKKKSSSSSSDLSPWAVGSFLKKIGTSMENEKNYDLLPNAPIRGIVLNHVEMTGKEIKQALNAANENVCKQQFCTMLTSNCYTASMYTMLQFIRIIHDRKDFPDDKKDIAMAKMWGLVQDRAIDNYAFGVRNNSMLMEEFQFVRSLLASRPGLAIPSVPAHIRIFPGHKEIKNNTKHANEPPVPTSKRS